jgi:hypothetical protein
MRPSNRCEIITACGLRATPKSIAPPNIWNGRKRNSASRSSNRDTITTLIRFIFTNPAGTIGRSSRTSMPLKRAGKDDKSALDPTASGRKVFGQGLRSPSSYPRHSGKRGSRSLRALLPRSPWSRSREAVVQLLLRQTFSNAVVVVCIQALKQNRPHLSRYQRFTLSVDSADAVHKAYQSLEADRRDWRIKDLEKVEAIGGDAFFLFSDLNGNWWEITSEQR